MAGSVYRQNASGSAARIHVSLHQTRHLYSLSHVVADPTTSPALADLVAWSKRWVTATIHLRPGRSSPNSSYGHFEAFVPRVVVEVSDSQKRKDLKGLARDHIAVELRLIVL